MFNILFIIILKYGNVEKIDKLTEMVTRRDKINDFTEISHLIKIEFEPTVKRKRNKMQWIEHIIEMRKDGFLRIAY